MKDFNRESFQALENYIKKYKDNVTDNNASKAISEFDESWNTIVDETYENQSKYAIALVILSIANYNIQKNIKENLDVLSKLISEFSAKIKSMPGVKQTLFYNLGGCWYKLGALYYYKVIEAFKTYIYYQIVPSAHKCYYPTAYAFRKCNTFLYQALVNEQLYISSPTTFNDPFDCPIRELLNNGTEISYLMRQAYTDCLKIACFTSNIKLPYQKEPNNPSSIVSNEKKHKRDRAEFLNTLMWAHYADSHSGICIKYRFYESISSLGSFDKNIVSYFNDVRYSKKDMRLYSKLNTINVEDAFFLKGKEWEYENELRFLYYDANGKGEHSTIDIPNCIEAIYFGLKCSNKDRDTIINLMKNKKVVIKDIYGNTKENPVKFYQMVIDKKQFGQLKVEKIK